MKRSLIIAVAISCNFVAARAQNAGTAGAFSRLGYGARGMGMGNAMTAVTDGEIVSYYNPALIPFATDHIVSATFGILSFDRYLNFLSYTQPIAPRAGVSAGLINAGVRDIDGRDNDGVHTDNYSTTENEFYLAFANRVDEHVSLGVSIKLYYAKLYDQVSTTTVGFDAGGVFPVTEDFSLGIAVQDLGSKYKWDTKAIYGENGRQTEDKFPTLRRIGASYTFRSVQTVLSAEIENSSDQTTLFRMGGEYRYNENFALRAGLDRWDLTSSATGVKPTFGFTLRNSFNGWSMALHYAYMIEGYSPQGMHMITLSGIL